ncbi:class II fructose-bisphosphatase [Marinithermus hydrothermalis]|uniref:Fructose-1,6-bisphosphatase n=1 Tax=Marinithermus hydrothermalis (strain DSM 14884 / JCM 11576 / T1) TaxID=869210 RepID=F2NPD2_MARHT|nr:class II fructose-bisphosphatase [Marinithermus hydrothermalis]AEB12213.1 fructose-1,6-bisphosphatase, class II [Marinithermus hydrothermalis DSM 14884]
MNIERELVLEIVRVTENAALAASRHSGKGNKHAVDQAGTEAMRTVLNELEISGTVVIGEGEMDEAPMLYIGERLGKGGPEVDIAVDPVEGTNITAKGQPNSVAVLAISEKGGLFHAPDIYMEKLIVGPPAAGRVDLTWPVSANLKAIALSLQRSVEDLVVVVLERPRHEKLIQEIREAGARVKLIGDGDVIAAISAAIRGTGVHAVMGIGGAPEGVLAAAALKCLGGEIQARFLPETEEERQRLHAMGASEDRIYRTEDLAPGKEIVFAATGITDGDILEGVRFFGGGARTHSLAMGYATRVVRFIDTVHLFDRGARVTIRV